jgi:hypothetical protein
MEYIQKLAALNILNVFGYFAMLVITLNVFLSIPGSKGKYRKIWIGGLLAITICALMLTPMTYLNYVGLGVFILMLVVFTVVMLENDPKFGRFCVPISIAASIFTSLYPGFCVEQELSYIWESEEDKYQTNRRYNFKRRFWIDILTGKRYSEKQN